MLVAQCFLQKSIREMWALYDSFKRSYYNLKYMLDDYPYPVFVVSKKGDYNIIYSNTEGEKFYNKMKSKRAPEKPITGRPRAISRRDW